MLAINLPEYLSEINDRYRISSIFLLKNLFRANNENHYDFLNMALQNDKFGITSPLFKYFWLRVYKSSGYVSGNFLLYSAQIHDITRLL